MEQLEAGAWVRAMFAEGERLRAACGDEAVDDLALGQPFDPPPQVRAAIRAAAAEDAPGRNAYMPNLGYPAVRERLASDVDAPGMGAEHIAVTGGAGAAISLGLRAVVDPGEEVVGVLPGFGEYRAYAAAAGARFVGVRSGPDLRIDLEGVEAALGERAAALILNSPCNPTGHVLDEAEMHDVGALLEAHARRRGRPAVLIVDEVYRRIRFAPSAHASPFSMWPATMLARSFSKDLGLAGERIGYLAVHPDLAGAEMMRGLEMAQRALGFVNAPATMQRALLRIGSFDVDVAPYRERRDHAVRCAQEAGLDVASPEGGIFLWFRSPWRDGLAFARALAERRVLVAPGIAFGDPGYVRVCLTAPRPAVERCLALAGELGLDAELSA